MKKQKTDELTKLRNDIKLLLGKYELADKRFYIEQQIWNDHEKPHFNYGIILSKDESLFPNSLDVYLYTPDSVLKSIENKLQNLSKNEQ